MNNRGLQTLPVTGRHAEHVRDDVGGQGICQVRNDVHPAGGCHRVQQVVGDLAYLRAQRVDRGRGEVPLQQLLQAHMVGRIGVSHPEPDGFAQRPQLVLFFLAEPVEPAGQVPGGQPPVLQRRDDVRVPGEHVGLQLRAPADRAFRAHPPQQRHGILDGLGREEII